MIWCRPQIQSIESINLVNHILVAGRTCAVTDYR